MKLNEDSAPKKPMIECGCPKCAFGRAAQIAFTDHINETHGEEPFHQGVPVTVNYPDGPRREWIVVEIRPATPDEVEQLNALRAEEEAAREELAKTLGTSTTGNTSSTANQG